MDRFFIKNVVIRFKICIIGTVLVSVFFRVIVIKENLFKVRFVGVERGGWRI